MTAVRGRRPGGADTRAEIVAAARAIFSEEGYADASMRAIARRAGVDPALIHHYFSDKAQLFVVALAIPFDPRSVQESVAAHGFSGGRLIERFLAQWEQGPGPGSPAFVSLAQAMAASPKVADAMREFIVERIGPHGPTGEDEEGGRTRRALIGSQLMGIAWARYVMRMEPVATADRAQVARWVGPTIDRYAAGRLED